MSNCLFEAAFEKILEDCHCAPGFHNEGGADAMEVNLIVICPTCIASAIQENSH